MNKLKVRPSNNWSTGWKNVSPDLVDDEFLDTKIIILLQGANLYADLVYSYVELIERNLKRMFAKMQAGENFKPANFGTVLYAGRGKVPQEVRDEMKNKYNMIDVPGSSPVLGFQPGFLDEEDI